MELPPVDFPPLDVLSHVERRRILTELSSADGSIAVSRIDRPLTSGAVEAEILNDILYYHVPKLVEHGYVSFDRRAGTVSRGPRFDSIRPYLASTNGHRTDRHRG